MKMTNIKKFVIAEKGNKFWVERKIMGCHFMRVPVQHQNKNGTSSVKTFDSYVKAEDYIQKNLITKYYGVAKTV